MSLLGTLGLWSLALGALSGWLVAASIDQPQILRRLGIKHPGRVRQTHLDWIMMGLILLGPDRDWAYVAAAILFAIAATTDFVDGYLARRWALTTTFGSFLDTTADKLLVSGVLIALLAADRASAWIVALIIGRELVIMGLRGAIAPSTAWEDVQPGTKAKAGDNLKTAGGAAAELLFPTGRLSVEDERIIGTQTVTFAALGEGPDRQLREAQRDGRSRGHDVTRGFR